MSSRPLQNLGNSKSTTNFAQKKIQNLEKFEILNYNSNWNPNFYFVLGFEKHFEFDFELDDESPIDDQNIFFGLNFAQIFELKKWTRILLKK